MKQILQIMVIAFLAIGFNACTGTQTMTKEESESQINFTSLADYLKTKGGVLVTGTGSTVQLQIRGINSIQGDSRPFIYVDRTPMGRSYAIANQAVNPNNIKSVRIISSLSELAIYGEDGNAGVILIKTKNNSSK